MDKSIRVLNVEDSERDVALLTRHLSGAGYTLTSDRVETAAAMAAALETSEWDVILCDYSMPQFSALAALRVLKNSGLDIPLIIISGTVGEDVAVEAMLSGASDYLMKDSLVRLAPTIEREIQEAENRRSQRQTEAALKASEAELRALFAAMTDVILVLGADGYFRKIGPTDPTFLYKPPQDLIGKNLKEVFTTEQADFFLKHIRKALDEGRLHRVEYRIQIDGAEVWFDGSVSPMSDDSVLWIGRDITQRKRAEDGLRESESLLSTTQNIAHIGSWVMDISESGDVVQNSERWSDEHFRIFGFEPGEVEITDEVFYNCVHPDDRERLASTVLASIEQKAPFDIEHRIILPDGGERTMHAVARVLLDEETGKPVKLLGSVQDITERKNAEEALVASEERYRSVVETAPDVIVTIDDSSTIVFVNPAAEKVFGYGRDEMKGASLTMLMPEYLRHLHAAGLERYQRTGEKHASWDYLELTGLHKTGREIPITLSFSEFTQNGRRYFTGIMRDITERKQAMEALRSSEERYRELVENAIDIIYTHDLKGNYTSVNRAAERITGYTNAESLAMSMADALAPEHLPIAQQMIAEKLAGNEITAYEVELIAKDGHRVALEVNTRIIYGNRVAVGVQGIARDVTERKKAEQALKETEERYRDLVENAIDIIYTLDPEGNYTSVNKAGERITGYSREETLARNISHTLAPEYLEQGAHFHTEQLAGRDVNAFELEVIAIDGHRVALEINTRAITENGAVVGIQGIARDITERKAVEAARLASERKYQDLFRLAPVGIYQSHADGSVTTANATLARMLGYDTVDEFLGTNLADIYFDPGIRRKLLDKYGKKGIAEDVDIQWKRKDGSPIWIQLTAHRIKGPDGAAEYFEGFVRDITDSKLAEATLRESDEKFHQLADHISDVFWIRSPDMNKIYYISPAYEQIWGRKLESNYDDPHQWYDFIFPPDRQSVMDAYAELMNDAPQTEVEYRIVRPDGEQRWVRTRGFQVKDANGEVIRLAGIVTDITCLLYTSPSPRDRG
jgi:PAS domain S-box-containing protein